MSLVAPERSPEPPRERRPEQGPAARPDRRHEGGARTNEPDAFARTPAPSVDGTEKLHLKIGGMACSFCVASITRALGRMEGVRGVGVSLAHEEALIEYDPAQVTSTELKQTLLDLGYTVRDATRARTVEEEEADLRRERNNLLVAAGFTLVALFVVMSSWMTGPMPAGGVFPALALWLMPTLALSTVFGPGWHILTMAWASLRRGILNQHVLLEFGAFAGLIGGTLGFFRPTFPRADFFAVAVFITTYHILSGYASLFVRTRASQAVRKLLELQPPTARVIHGGQEEEVSIEEVGPGDLVRVRPGESVPVDGVVINGASAVDESLVTGEPIPKEKVQGDEVIGGSINQSGSLVVRVTRVGELIGREVAARLGVDFGIVDLSLAPTPQVGDSVGEILQAMGVVRLGAPGSTAALALLNDAVKKGGSFASSSVGGLSGAFVAVSEDAALAEAAARGDLTLAKLEAMTAVCSVGLDMIAVAGDTDAETLAALIADEIAIGVINHKTTAVRVIPVPGKSAGERAVFGGLFGEMTILPVHAAGGSTAFIRHGGRIPAPLSSLRT